MIALEVGVLVGATVLAAHVLTKPPVRREIRAHPVLALVALLVGLAVVALFVYASRRFATVFHVGVGVIALTVVSAVMRARHVYRVATRDLTVGSYRIPRGWLVRLRLGEAREGKDRFVEPHAFNPDRFATRAPGSDHFAPFGHGRHACLGADLTLTIAQEFLHEAVLHFDICTVADGAPWRINRHWELWRPSQQWRVASVPRTPALR